MDHFNPTSHRYSLITLQLSSCGCLCVCMSVCRSETMVVVISTSDFTESKIREHHPLSSATGRRIRRLVQPALQAPDTLPSLDRSSRYFAAAITPRPRSCDPRTADGRQGFKFSRRRIKNYENPRAGRKRCTYTPAARVRRSFPRRGSERPAAAAAVAADRLSLGGRFMGERVTSNFFMGCARRG